MQPKLSPDGKWVSLIAPFKSISNLAIAPRGTHDFAPVTTYVNRGVHQYWWSWSSDQLLYLRDVTGNENHRLRVIDLVSGVDHDVVPLDDVQVRLLALDPELPDEALIGLNADRKHLHDIYRLHLRSGMLTKVLDNPGVSRWLIGPGLRVRGYLRAKPHGTMDLAVFDEASGYARMMMSFEADDVTGTKVIGFDRSGKTLYLVTPKDADTSRCLALDTITGALDVVASDADYDIDDVSFSLWQGTVQWVSILGARLIHRAIDPSVHTDLSFLAALEDADFQLVDRDQSDRLWLVAFRSDRAPAEFRVYDRHKRQTDPLLPQRGAVAASAFASMETFELTARDGLRLRGYATFPRRRPRRDLPMILLIHAGPWSRDRWGFDPIVQWLSARGYLCVQVNYRGSSGYGKAFLNAGNGEWGGKMQCDLYDTVDLMVGQGFADPKRVAALGWSYGGYAALACASFEPDRFACCIAGAAPSNLLTLLHSLPAYWQPDLDLWYRRVGDPSTDADMLAARSPALHADDIRVPILLVHGANDVRVKLAEAEQMVEVLRRRGVVHEFLLFPDEGHGIAKAANRVRFLQTAEAFLARHL